MLVQIFEITGGHGTRDSGFTDWGEFKVGPVICLDDIGQSVTDGASVQLQLGSFGLSGGRHFGMVVFLSRRG